MYRELLPLHQAFSTELKINLTLAVPGIDSAHLLQSCLDRWMMYMGCDVADRTLTCFAVANAGEYRQRLTKSCGAEAPGFTRVLEAP